MTLRLRTLERLRAYLPPPCPALDSRPCPVRCGLVRQEGCFLLARRAISGACPGDGARGAGGMKFIMGSHLTTAAKLSNDWGPPLFLTYEPRIPNVRLDIFRQNRAAALAEWRQLAA